MKKRFTAFIVALFAAVAVFALAGCSDNRNNSGDAIENGHTIVYAFTASEDVMTITETSSMYDYMNALKEVDLVFDGYNDEYGFYVTSVFGVSGKTISSTANSYTGWDWMVYTTVTTVDGVIYSGEESTVIDGVTLYKASYGVSGLPCIAGESYALVYELSSMTW